MLETVRYSDFADSLCTEKFEADFVKLDRNLFKRFSSFECKSSQSFAFPAFFFFDNQKNLNSENLIIENFSITKFIVFRVILVKKV